MTVTTVCFAQSFCLNGQLLGFLSNTRYSSLQNMQNKVSCYVLEQSYPLFFSIEWQKYVMTKTLNTEKQTNEVLVVCIQGDTG